MLTTPALTTSSLTGPASSLAGLVVAEIAPTAAPGAGVVGATDLARVGRATLGAAFAGPVAFGTPEVGEASAVDDFSATFLCRPSDREFVSDRVPSVPALLPVASSMPAISVVPTATTRQGGVY
jgi:hypothetical protein